MPFDDDEFHFIEVDGTLVTDSKVSHYKAVRLVHKETGRNFGEYFQEACRSMPWKSAGIVHEKYKRKFNLTFEDYISLRRYAEEVAEERKTVGKPLNQDFLVQMCSAELKKRYANRPKQVEDALQALTVMQ
jgi:beta-phosphoglucomutase-like phosphatase (HAD superfamily)